MKYSEFTKEVEKLGYGTMNNGTHLYIINARGSRLIHIDKTETCSIETTYALFNTIPDGDKHKLFLLTFRLASTPPEEREDEKRYRLKLPFIKSYGYLNLDKINGVYELSGEKQVNNYQTIFAESEVEELKQNYNLDSFVMEEVKEDE